MRQFTDWAYRIGGLLQFMGVDGFLGNRDLVDDLDDDEAALAVFWSALHDKFGGVDEHGKPCTFTSAQAVGVIDTTGDDLEGELPSFITKRIKRDVGGYLYPDARAALTRTVGYTLRNHRKQYIGGMRVDKAGEDPHTKSKVWKIKSAGHAGDAGDDSAENPPKTQRGHISEGGQTP